jgi:Short C-terminal domain
MPGLLRMMGRTAVIAGTATTVSNRVSRRQARKWGAEEQQAEPPPQQQYAPPPQQYAPPPPPAPAADPIQQLKDLADLKQQGVLTDAEFAAQKAKILAA